MPQIAIAASPIAAPTVLKRHSAAILSTELLSGAPVRVALASTATSADSVAVFVTDDSAVTATTLTATFNPEDPTTWPAACQYLGTITGGNPKTAALTVAPSEDGSPGWGPYLVLERLLGTGAIGVEVTGDEGPQVAIAASPIAAPTTLKRHSAAIVSSELSCDLPVRVALASGATSADSVAVFVTDDAAVAATTLTVTFDPFNRATWPAGCQYLGTITGGNPKTAALTVAPSKEGSPGWGPFLVLERLLGTGALNVIVTGNPGKPQGDVDITATANTIAKRNAAGGLQATSFTRNGVGVDGDAAFGSSAGVSATTVLGGTDGVVITGGVVTATASKATGASVTRGATGTAGTADANTAATATGAASASTSATSSAGNAMANTQASAVAGNAQIARTASGAGADLSDTATATAGNANADTSCTASAEATANITCAGVTIVEANRTCTATGGLARANTTCTATTTATANTTCTGATGTQCGLSAAITGGATASAAVSCTAAVGDGFKVSTGATPTVRLFIDQSGFFGFYGHGTAAQPTAYTLTFAGAVSKTLPAAAANLTGQDKDQAGSVYPILSQVQALQTQVNGIASCLKQLLTDLASNGLIAG